MLSVKALEIEHFKKQYQSFEAVKDISFSIDEGNFFGFLGPNGAGKSSTIHCITGIATVSSGSIKVFNYDVVHDYRMARKQVGLSPQEFNIDIFLPVEKILWYMGGYYGMSKSFRKKRIAELLKIFDLESHAQKPFRALSGGLKRRVTIARAMIHDPKLLILDEPTAGVDVELRHDLWKYLARINEEGKTILLTSHYLEEVEKLCDSIAIIHKGEIAAIGEKKDFLEGGKTLEERYLEITQEEQ